MKKHSRQDVFNKVWDHFVVEGRSYAAKWDEFLRMPIPANEDDNNNVSPSALFVRQDLNNHVTKKFLAELENCHTKSFWFAFDDVNYDRIKNMYARRFQRLFRRTMKFFLINFAMQYGLSVTSEYPKTVHAKKAARKFKK